MAGHQIGHDVLLFPHLLIKTAVFFQKAAVNRIGGLAHHREHRIGDVLGRNLELSRDVMAHQLAQKGIVLIAEQVIEPDSAADKHLLDAGDRPQPPQQRQVIPMIDEEVFAGGGEQALPLGTDPLFELLLAARMPEVGGRPAHVVDIALKILFPGHPRRLRCDGVVAANLDDPALMKGQGTEAAAAEAAPVGGQAEPDLPDRGDPAQRLIGGVGVPPVGQGVNPVHLVGGKRLLRWILYDKAAFAVGLRQTFGGKRVGVAVLGVKALGIPFPVGQQRLVGRQRQTVIHLIEALCAVNRPVDEGDIFDIQPARKGVGHLNDAALPHAVHQQIGLAVEQNRPFERIGPIIVMRQPSQAGLDPADQHRLAGKAPADQVAVNNGRIVGAPAHHAARGKGVGRPAPLGDGIMVYH